MEKETSKRAFWEDKNKREEPTYDVKLVDTKIVKINMALFLIDKLIKASNAITEVEVGQDFNLESLMSEIQ